MDGAKRGFPPLDNFSHHPPFGAFTMQASKGKEDLQQEKQKDAWIASLCIESSLSQIQ